MGRVIKKTVSSLGCIKPAPTLISALLVLAVGVLVALLGGDRSLFSVVNKPAFTPPAFVFPIVWTVIYLLIGGAAGAVLGESCRAPESEKYRSLFKNNEQFSISDEKYKVMSENYLTNSRREIYPNDLMFTKEQFIGNRISRSYAPKSGDPEFDNYRTALEEFFEQHQQNGVILIPNNTVCFIGMA